MHRACGRLAAAVGMLGNVTMSDPGPGRHASHVPSISTYLDISRRFPPVRWAAVAGTLAPCTFGIISVSNQGTAAHSRTSMNFGSQFLQLLQLQCLQRLQLRNSAKLPHLLHRPSTHSSQLWVLHGATSHGEIFETWFGGASGG